MKRLSLAILLLLTIAAPSCVGTDVGNPQQDKADVELEFAGYAETQQGALTLESDARIDTAWIVLSQLRFRSVAECEEDTAGSYDVTEPVVIDLLASEPAYQAPMFTKPAGDYCKLDVGFAHLDAAQLPDGVPAELEGLSVLVEGARADGVEFRIEAAIDGQFHLNGIARDIVLEKGRQHLIVGFALDEWLNETRLDNVDDDEPIVINAESHPELLADFEASVKRSARMFRDKNDNRRLDADEKGQAIGSSARDLAEERNSQHNSNNPPAQPGQ